MDMDGCITLIIRPFFGKDHVLLLHFNEKLQKIGLSRRFPPPATAIKYYFPRKKHCKKATISASFALGQALRPRMDFLYKGKKGD